MKKNSNEPKRPYYLKKYCQKGKYTIWIVDGYYIRTNIDEEFTNFGHHYRFKFIPKNELWLDKENNPGEEEFFIDNMLVFIRNFKNKKTYEESRRLGDNKEKSERKKSLMGKMPYEKKEFKKEILKRIHKEEVKINNPKLKVWIVNGELVRDLFFIDFTEGGHDKVYDFVPDYEIWLDDDLSLKEREFVLLHEIHERNLMSRGWNYNKSHSSSSNIEFFCRHYKRKFKKIFEEELKLII